jgi:hypothetical protein
MSLAPSDCRTTVQNIGSFALRDQAGFFQSGKLSDGVNDYIVDRLTLLGVGLNKSQQSSWSELVNSISKTLGRSSVSDYIEARDRAERYLEKQKLPDRILKARRIFEGYEITPNPSDLQFFVGTDPSPETFPTLITSTTSESLLPSDEQKFRLKTVAGDRDFGEVRVTTAKVFRDIRLIRPWLPDYLLDDGIDLPEGMATRHFGSNGSLRLVPVEMVVFVGLDVSVDIDDTKSADVTAAVQTNRCCELQSPELNIRLATNSIRKVGEDRYRGRTEPADPKLVAIISRRRVPR